MNRQVSRPQPTPEADVANAIRAALDKTLAEAGPKARNMLKQMIDKRKAQVDDELLTAYRTAVHNKIRARQLAERKARNTKAKMKGGKDAPEAKDTRAPLAHRP